MCVPTINIALKQTDQAVILSTKLVEHVLNTWVIGEKDFSDLSTSGLDCFKIFFCSINIQSLKMKRRNEFEILDFALEAVDALWNLTFSVKNNQVFNLASDFLVKLHTEVVFYVNYNYPFFKVIIGAYQLI